MNDFRIVPAGDSAIVIEFDERIDVAINRRVLALAESIARARIPGVRDVVPTFRSAAIYFDPLRTDVPALMTQLESDVRRPSVRDGGQRPAVRIPVCYGGECGPDLEAVATCARIDPADAVALHCGRTYRVFMLGFLPGFAYLASVDERIAVPRLATPRTRVPAGSVGIAGAQTGIYPSESPGGWQLIGRTPVKLFDAERHDPFLLKPGDDVEFYPIDESDFARL